MSVAARIFSGSLAAWFKIGVTALTQIALVPVYLGHWSLQTYGCWLVIQATTSFVNILSLAHHNVVANEMLRVPASAPQGLSALLSSAWPFSMGWGLLEVLAIAALMAAGGLQNLFAASDALPDALLRDAQLGLLVVCATTYLCVSTTGLFGRVATALGHYPRTAWWGVLLLGVGALAPLGAVLLGHGLWEAALSLAMANLVVFGLYQMDLWRLARRHAVRLGPPDWRLGWHNFRAAGVLGASYLCGLVRQQGLRVLVGSTLGMGPAVAYTTLRTASNLSLQGVATVVDPTYPEFMRFLRERNRPAIVGTFAFLWLLIVFAMGPVLVALQAFAPELFTMWTRGKLPFDAWSFAGFSAGMLVLALARPADAILLGNNLLRAQFSVAAGAATATVLGVLALGGWGGLRAIVALLLAVEVAVAAAMIWRAAQWLRANELEWPSALFRVALAEVIACSAALAWLCAEPAARNEVLALTFALTALLLAGFVAQVPAAHRLWVLQRLGRLPLRLRRR